MLEKRLWPEQHPLWQFPSLLESHYITKLEKFDLWPDTLYTMDPEVCPVQSSCSHGMDFLVLFHTLALKCGVL